MSDEDQRAFREAMSGVRPLPPRDAVATPPRPRAGARFTRADEFAEPRDRLLLQVDSALPDGRDELSFRRPGVRDDVLRRLRRGRYPVAAEIDLHGLGRHAAYAALREFIAESTAHDLGCVRVIHGKGRGSGPRGPVLKRVVNQWLQCMDDVVAFASARPADGGTGAAYVLLANGQANRSVPGRRAR